MTKAQRVECLALATPLGRFAIESGRLRELVAIDGCTPVPGSPASVAGITTLRGSVVVVLSGERLLDTDKEELLIVFDRDDDRRLVGLAVESISGVETVDTDIIIPPESFDGRIPDRELPIKAVILPMGRSRTGEPTFVLDTDALGESAPEPPKAASN